MMGFAVVLTMVALGVVIQGGPVDQRFASTIQVATSTDGATYTTALEDAAALMGWSEQKDFRFEEPIVTR